MKYKKLRIAWSVGWGAVAVLLCLLWVRSYWWVEIYYGQLFSKRFVGLAILPGAIGGSIDGKVVASSRDTLPTDQWLESTERTISRVVVNQKRLETLNPQMLKQLKPPPPLPSRIWGVFRLRRGEVWIPFWFLCLLAATLAALPSVQWSKRFSLRTMLIATTVVAVLLGIIIYATPG